MVGSIAISIVGDSSMVQDNAGCTNAPPRLHRNSVLHVAVEIETVLPPVEGRPLA